MSSAPTLDSSLASLQYVFNDQQLVRRIRDAKILLVGAGGIGCEVVKTMLLIGFTDFTLIDLDTIDVSNLNRQFLFNKTHVGQSKAEVAAKVAISRFAHKDLSEKEGKEVSVKPELKPIQHQDFDLEEFKKYTIVINALDNRAARSHVNRMCLAAGVPLIESGSEGYMGQTYVIQKGVSHCYDCDGPKTAQKTFASCTIRNTPSLPIHCIVWGKHLFAQLFGESDADNDVSPDVNDPELNENKDPKNHVENGKNQERGPSTREWAKGINYDPKLIFEKLFTEDIKYLLKMDKLWQTRRKPVPLVFEDVLTGQIAGRANVGVSNGVVKGQDLRDQRLWSLKECYEVFANSISKLKDRLKDDDFLVWDKDDEPALDFVTAVSNLRSQCFNIERKSKFDVKSMAGNIIPAIPSTNSIVGGLIALQAVGLLRKVLSKSADELSKMGNDERYKLFNQACRHVYVCKVGSTSDQDKNKSNAVRLVVASDLDPPNAKCLICSSDIPEVEIQLSLKETKLYDFVDQIILQKLHFVCPDIQVEGQACLLYNQEDAEEESEEEKNASRQRLLSDFSLIRNNTRLKIYDLIQNQTIIVTLKDVVVDPNKNDGLWYRLVVVSEGSSSNDEGSKEEEGGDDESDDDIIEEVDADVPIVLESDSEEDIPIVTEGIKRPPSATGGDVDSPSKKKRIS